MPTARRPDALNPMADVLTSLVRGDDELKSTGKRLIRMMYSDLERTMRYGMPQDKAVYMKAILPGLLRASQDTGGAEITEQQRADERIQALLRGEDLDGSPSARQDGGGS